ncbi:MAG TPA: dienelactone hydrolase family protein [Kofleriaceae bacterium]|nr:dienelactone hydrolase family protein [Kofleriaceae bacterium]
MLQPSLRAALVALAVTAGCGASSSSSASHACDVPTTAAVPAGVRELHFPAADGLDVTADLYAPHPDSAPFIVLFHQAGSSRGEYRAIAPRLVDLGFNVMAVDARSGHDRAQVGNATAAAACRAGKPTTYVDAIADLRAAVAEARNHAKGKLLIWGSSYSSSLVLVLGAELHADAVLAFSPGEYFEDQGKPKTWVRDSATALAVPVFITSAQHDSEDFTPIADAIDHAGKTHVTRFLPTTAGTHGSSALAPTQPDSAAYWTAVTAFLAPFTAAP